MSYEVLITSQARRELKAATDWIAEKAPQTAARWFKGFVEAIMSLSENPERFPLAHESSQFRFELRQLLYGKRRNYRALFTIRGDSVVVLTIRHAAQRDLRPRDLESF